MKEWEGSLSFSHTFISNPRVTEERRKRVGVREMRLVRTEREAARLLASLSHMSLFLFPTVSLLSPVCLEERDVSENEGFLASLSLPHALSLLFVSHLISLLSMEEETDK
eukprot:CAMPEP_0181467676 /NCGR_PEP_ID=MMETSP1110-20121109/37105_1 /TAXON_ID=174948 /ORGANISM="Symbiodinium sp., Strain CCMP421" /LENGTH=109 /DNA_ID=CAMNT_0023592517 /DNA_START=2821 /DNA_END=3150 /DNA_ORIENTATION=-